MANLHVNGFLFGEFIGAVRHITGIAGQRNLVVIAGDGDITGDLFSRQTTCLRIEFDTRGLLEVDMDSAILERAGIHVHIAFGIKLETHFFQPGEVSRVQQFDEGVLLQEYVRRGDPGGVIDTTDQHHEIQFR